MVATKAFTKKNTEPASEIKSSAVQLSSEMTDWLSGDIERIKDAKVFLRKWFLAYNQTNTFEEISEQQRIEMFWLYELLDDFMTGCMEAEFDRQLANR